MIAQLPLSTLELARVNLPAWEALPSPYREDECLEFYVFFDIVFCRPKPEEEPIIGKWECFFCSSEGVWKDTETGETYR